MACACRNHRGNERGLRKDFSVLAFVFLLFAAPTAALADAIPQELIGKWSDSTDDFCGVEFTSTGYIGHADSERYACDVKRVRTLSKPWNANLTWRMKFVCHGEFGKIRVGSLIHLQTIKGAQFLAQVDTINSSDAKKAVVPPVSILYKCR